MDINFLKNKNMNNKKYCPIHCFNYSGPKCPICESERIGRMVKHFSKAEEHKENIPKQEEKEVSQESLNMLLEKFNSFKK